MKKERIKDLLNLDENNFKLDEFNKEKVRKKHQAKQQNGDKDSNNEPPSKKDPEPKKDAPETPAAKPSETPDTEATPESKEDLTKKVWKNVLIMIWNKHPSKNRSENLRDTLVDVVNAIEWENKKNPKENEVKEENPNAENKKDVKAEGGKNEEQ